MSKFTLHFNRGDQMTLTGSPSPFPKRQAALSKKLQNSGYDALALNPGPSLTYLTGLHFHLIERPVVFLLIPGKQACIILPELETAKLYDLPFLIDTFPYGEDPSQWIKAFQQAAKTAGLSGKQKVGIEPRAMRILEIRLLEEAMPLVNFVPAEESIAALRMYKDAQEVEAMQRAAKIAQDALQAILAQIKIGMSEKEIANELTIQLLKYGSNPISTGPNSANPHAFPSNRKLAEGDLLVIDWGANVDGYFSDITRTFAVGQVDAEFAKIAGIVHQANQAGHATASPGLPASEVDRASRAIIEQAGYGEFFTHRTGHGLGMEAHEEPYIRGDNQLLLESGMTFTIEPGIYLPNRGGFRIEDDVVITAEGCQSLTDLPRELIVIG
jgi:Xaa-Pro dipeptidase